ncbi:heavy-metal-associated domain-containing protein, partial [Pandoraea sp.]|uniref:heavy-metal-associated domain-containing protein n=1 Tax=Pandoraea sp. TaxID=1883445 RepID=UPI0025CBE415
RRINMKAIAHVFVLAAALWLPMAANASPAAAVPAAAAHSTYYQLQVEGLACPFCAYGIEKKLHAIKGVEQVQTDIASGSVYLRMSAGAALDEATADQAVKAAGFHLKSLKPTSDMPSNPED